MIEASGIRISRGGTLVLDGADLVANEGETVGIVGPNGSGKSTFMLALYRALPTDAGEVLIDHEELSSLSRRQIAGKIAVVAQERENTLPLSVHDSIALGRLATRSLVGYGDAEDEELIERAMEKVHLSHLSERLLTQLSGGEKQRVLIARAMVQQASHLFLDEPTNHLDLHYQFELMQDIEELNCTTVIVLHDLNLAAQCCDRIILLNEGSIVAAGTPSEVLKPEILSPVYRLKVTTIDHNGRPYLIFDPLD